MPDHRQPLPPAPGNDDRFELLRAGRALFQRQLGEIIGKSGVARPSLLAAFGRALGEAYDQLASARPREDFDETGELTASRLTLMGDDDLEIDIRISDIGSHLRDAAGRDLGRSQLRYMTLLGRPKMKAAGNPVGPDAICHGLWAICRESGGSLEQTLALLDRIEKLLLQQLPTLYREIDALLAGRGVEPASAQGVPAAVTAGRDGERRGDGGRTPANPLSTLQQAMRQQRGTDQTIPAGQSFAHGDAQAANPTVDAAAMVMLKHLLDRLTALETQSTASGGQAVQGRAVPPLPLCAVKSGDLDLPLGKPEAITLDTMGLIFESIFDSPDLPDTIKAAIARLHIPLLKLAITDPTLFADSMHPARQLINRLARAAIGLPRTTGWEDPVCKRIGSVTTAVRATLDRKGASLEPYLAELDALIGERDQAVRRATAGHVLLVVEYEKEQHAEHLVNSWLRTTLAAMPAPEIASFIEKYWSQVMLSAALAGGTDGTRWQQDSTTAAELIWSVRPKDSAEERQRLAAMASSLLRRIGAGLDEIGVTGAERSPFLNSLFDLQTAALRAQAPIATTPPATTPGDPCQAGPRNTAEADTGPRILKRDGLRVHHLGVPIRPAPPRRRSPADWQVGDWLRFRATDKETLCGLCCWQSPSSGTVVLFNPAWSYAVAMPATTLDQQLGAGVAQLVSRIALFDAAAESALSRLEMP